MQKITYMDTIRPLKYTQMLEAGCPSLEFAADRATLWLNRSGQGNRMDDTDLRVFHELLMEVEANGSIRVLTLRARGKTFCAGYDLKSLGRDAPGTPGFDQLVDSLENLRVPTVAALTGSVYGGGTDLTLACDFRIGVPEIEFAMPAARLGIHYYYNGMRRYVARLGLGAAKRLFLLGDRIPAQEMLRVGFLDEIVEIDAMEARLEALTDTLANNAPTAVQGMKAALNGIAAGTARPEEIEAAWRRSLASADLREGLSAFAEKRRPKFAAPATNMRS
jgi:enoyl-CoA hydratase